MLLDVVLGPSEDLLVWSLKHPAAQLVGEMRPPPRKLLLIVMVDCF